MNRISLPFTFYAGTFAHCKNWLVKLNLAFLEKHYTAVKKYLPQNTLAYYIQSQLQLQFTLRFVEFGTG
jgi:hypothetical protein